jgi:hypothetical protein
MSQKTVRTAILVLGLITAFVHLVVLYIVLGGLDPKFILNGLGYLVLLWAFFANPGFVRSRRVLLNYVFIGYTVVTIAAWVIVIVPQFGITGDKLGLVTKLDEILLIAALAYDLRFESKA